MAVAADHQGLASPCSHDSDPQWFFPSPTLLEVSQFADMMNLNVLDGLTEFTSVSQEPFE